MKSIIKKTVQARWIFLVLLTACNGYMREDLRNDVPPYAKPTAGGLWPEGGTLSEQDIPGFNGQNRMPASGLYLNEEDQSWTQEEKKEKAKVSYTQEPNLPPPVKRLYGDGKKRATKGDFIDQSPNEGSLWASNGQTNYFFVKNSVKGVGDLLTMTVKEGLVQDVAAELKKTLTEDEVQEELKLAQERIKEKTLASQKTEDGSGDRAPAAAATEAPAGENKEGADTAASADKAKEKKKEEPKIPEATFADIDVTKSMGLKAGDQLTGTILERYPNGNYKFSVVKKVPYQGDYRTLRMVAVVREKDVDEAETTSSEKLYEYLIRIHR